MERISEKEQSQIKGYLFALVIVGIAFMLIFIAFGVDSVIPGIHDLFHDFRHGALGMPCH